MVIIITMACIFRLKLKKNHHSVLIFFLNFDPHCSDKQQLSRGFKFKTEVNIIFENEFTLFV